VKLGVNHGLICCNKKIFKINYLQLEVESLLFVDKVVISGKLVRSELSLKEGSWVNLVRS
jgi:hypothetical protein